MVYKRLSIICRLQYKRCRIVDKLEDKLKLIELCLTMSYDYKVNYTDVFSQVRFWDTLIYNFLRKDNIVIPPKEDNIKDEKYLVHM